MTNPNDAAFSYGLTKREYFAAMALQGLLAQPSYLDFHLKAEKAVRLADALIEELNKKEQ